MNPLSLSTPARQMILPQALPRKDFSPAVPLCQDDGTSADEDSKAFEGILRALAFLRRLKYVHSKDRVLITKKGCASCIERALCYLPG